MKKDLDEAEITTDAELRNWIGDVTSNKKDELSCADVKLTKEDPLCRLMYVAQVKCILTRLNSAVASYQRSMVVRLID